MDREQVRTLLKSRRVQLGALLLLALMVTVLLFQTYHKAYRADGYDFTSYLLSAEALANGENPYQTDTPFTYIYPMFLAFALIPLSLIPYWLANFLWYVVGVASLLGSVVLSVRVSSKSLQAIGGGNLLAPMVLSLLILLPVFQNNLLNGQVNFLVIFLCVLFLKYYIEKKAVPAAVFLALAGSIKIVPLILILFLLVRRELKMLGLSAVLFFAFCLLPIVTLGNDIFPIYGEYLQNFIFGKFSSEPVSNSTQVYFTLSGFASWVIPALSSWGGLKILSAAIIAGTVSLIDIYAVKKNGKAAGGWTFHLYLIAILMITPLSETHHLAFIMPLFTLLVVHSVFTSRLAIKWYLVALALFAMCFYLGRIAGGPFYFLALVTLIAAGTRIATSSAFEQSV